MKFISIDEHIIKLTNEYIRLKKDGNIINEKIYKRRLRALEIAKELHNKRPKNWKEAGKKGGE